MAASLLLAACGSSTAAPIAGTSAVADVAACPGSPSATIAGSVAVDLHAGPGVEASDVESLAADMAAVMGRHGIALDLRDSVDTVSPPPRLGGTKASIESLVAGGLTERAATEAAVYGSLTEYLERRAVPAVDVVHVVVVDVIAGDDSVAAAVVGDIAGIGLSGTEPAPGGLSPPFTPTVILSALALDALTPAVRAVSAAHELAHALGLDHDDRPWNLMNPDRRQCLQRLTVEQLDVVASSPAFRPAA